MDARQHVVVRVVVAHHRVHLLVVIAVRAVQVVLDAVQIVVGVVKDVLVAVRAVQVAQVPVTAVVKTHVQAHVHPHAIRHVQHSYTVQSKFKILN